MLKRLEDGKARAAAARAKARRHELTKLTAKHYMLMLDMMSGQLSHGELAAKYGYTESGLRTLTYSKSFQKEYESRLGAIIERRMERLCEPRTRESAEAARVKEYFVSKAEAAARLLVDAMESRKADGGVPEVAVKSAQAVLRHSGVTDEQGGVKNLTVVNISDDAFQKFVEASRARGHSAVVGALQAVSGASGGPSDEA